MAYMHIPVRLMAADPAEYQAFADILSGDQTGALALARPDEKPLAALVCPSGKAEDAGDVPSVILGGVDMPIPVRLADVLASLEKLVSATSGLDTPRSYKGWDLDPARLTLRTPDEKVVTLTDTEARLLACILDAKGEDVPRDMLLQRVWGYRPGLDTHTLETHIYRLRKKIEADPACPATLVTTDAGYRFAP